MVGALHCNSTRSQAIALSPLDQQGRLKRADIVYVILAGSSLKVSDKGRRGEREARDHVRQYWHATDCIRAAQSNGKHNGC